MTNEKQKLHDAKLEIAVRIVDVDKLRAAAVKSLGGSRPPFGFNDGELRSTDEGVAYLKAKGGKERLLERYASDPALFPHMRFWMIDFGGSEASMGAEGNLLPGISRDQAMRADHGGLPRRVSDWLEKRGFEVCDTGSGTGGWHIGVECSDEDAKRLCRMAHDELATEIAAGVLSIKLMFWGWGFPGLSHPEQATAFLAKALS